LRDERTKEQKLGIDTIEDEEGKGLQIPPPGFFDYPGAGTDVVSGSAGGFMDPRDGQIHLNAEALLQSPRNVPVLGAKRLMSPANSAW
jgi:hypothetical protein